MQCQILLKRYSIPTLVVSWLLWTVIFTERNAAHSEESLTLLKHHAHKRGYFVNNQGIYIKTRWWPPQGEAKAVVFLVSGFVNWSLHQCHGKNESSSSKVYAEFIKELQAAGYGVYAHDMQVSNLRFSSKVLGKWGVDRRKVVLRESL
jgi:hypothetical protein